MRATIPPCDADSPNQIKSNARARCHTYACVVVSVEVVCIFGAWNTRCGMHTCIGSADRVLLQRTVYHARGCFKNNNCV